MVFQDPTLVCAFNGHESGENVLPSKLCYVKSSHIFLVVYTSILFSCFWSKKIQQIKGVLLFCSNFTLKLYT